MSSSPNKSLDVNVTTTLAISHRTLIDGHDTETTEGRMMTLNGQTVATDGQAVMSTMGEASVVTGGDPTVTDGQIMTATAAEETAMVVNVDPAVCSLSAFLSADDAEQSESSVAPVGSVPVTPLTPRRDFLSAAESSPSVSGRGRGGSEMREAGAGCDASVMSARSRRVAGRRQAVIEDDGETQSSMSIASADEDGSMAASSSRAKNKGVKRGRETEKDKDRRNEGKTEEGSNEEKKRKRRGKKREAGRKDTPEEEESGKCGEPKGVVEYVFEDMSSSVLGGAILEWANKIDEIRVKSRNFQGRLSGEMKKCVTKIKEGTALLVARSEATGDPHFLRMRNTELTTQLREAERENARLKEQLRKMSLGPSPPRRKRKVEKADVATDAAQVDSVDPTTLRGTLVVRSLTREEFPPLSQRPPRNMAMRSGGNRVLPMVPAFSTAVCDSEGTETGAEAYFTQHIDFLTAAREMERDRRRKEHQGKEQVGLQDERKRKRTDKDEDRSREVHGVRKVGPRIVSNVQVAPPFKERLKEGTTASAVFGSEAEWRVVMGGRRRGRNMSDKPPPPSSLSCLSEEPSGRGARCGCENRW